MKKKLFIVSLLSLFSFISVNLDSNVEARREHEDRKFKEKRFDKRDERRDERRENKHQEYNPRPIFPKTIKPFRKDKPVIILHFPPLTFFSGTYNFYDHSNAELYEKRARKKGHKSSLFKNGPHWVVEIK